MKKIDSLTFPIIIIIFLCIGFYYNNESKKRLFKGDIISKQVTISKFEPKLTDYESTDDIEFEFSEFPEKVFEIGYLRIDFDKGKELISSLEINKKVIIDVEKQYYRKKIEQNAFLGIKPSISILGIRKSEQEEIPILDYNVEIVSKNLLKSYLSFIGALLISLFWIYEYFKSKIKNTTANTV